MHEKLFQQLLFQIIMQLKFLYIILHQNVAVQRALKINSKAASDGLKKYFSISKHFKMLYLSNINHVIYSYISDGKGAPLQEIKHKVISMIICKIRQVRFEPYESLNFILLVQKEVDYSQFMSSFRDLNVPAVASNRYKILGITKLFMANITEHANVFLLEWFGFVVWVFFFLFFSFSNTSLVNL